MSATLKVSIRTDEGLAQILDDVEPDLQRGRILGVVGESGCGKSTLMRAVMGILPQRRQGRERRDLVRGREPAAPLARAS